MEVKKKKTPNFKVKKVKMLSSCFVIPLVNSITLVLTESFLKGPFALTYVLGWAPVTGYAVQHVLSLTVNWPVDIHSLHVDGDVSRDVSMWS